MANELGWIIIIIAWSFAGFFIIWGYWMGKRINRISQHVKEMSDTIDRLNKELDEDAKKLDSFKNFKFRKFD